MNALCSSSCRLSWWPQLAGGGVGRDEIAVILSNEYLENMQGTAGIKLQDFLHQGQHPLLSTPTHLPLCGEGRSPKIQCQLSPLQH